MGMVDKGRVIPVCRLTAVLAVVLAACGSNVGPSSSISDGTTRPSSDTTPPVSVAVPDTTGTAGECAPFGGEPLGSVQSAQSVVLTEDLNGVRVEAVVYPLPDYRGRPWTTWGQGLALADGRFFSAVGDHLGAEGNSYIYEFDPDAGQLTMVADVDSLAGPHSWGFGKVHGHMVGGPCGEIYFSTYWGDKPEGDALTAFEGDVLFRIDPGARTIGPLGIPVPGYGVPSLTGSSALGLLYGEGVDPAIEPKDGPFFAYDMRSGTKVFESDTADSHQGFRNIAVDAEGRAYFSGDDNQLLVFDPATSTISPYPTPIPGKWLRASTVPGPEGTIYATTREPDQLFSFHPDGTVRDLGPAPDYVASLALQPDGTRFFYIPAAHGKAWLAGTPLMSFDVATGESEVLVELNELAEEKLGLSLGGTYGVVLSPSGDRLYTVLNSGNPANERDAAFGAVVLIIVDLP